MKLAPLPAGLASRTAGLAWACAVLLSGCAAAEALPPPSPPPARLPDGARLDRDFSLVEAVGQGMLLPLPDAEGWSRESRETKTWVVRHVATDSRLLVRTFRADGVARSEDCERQMRLWRPDLPVLPAERRADARRLHLDGGYAAQLVTGTEPRSHGVTGHALLVGGAGRECLCMAFSTSADGTQAAAIVGARLGSITRVFERAHRIDIADGVRPPQR